MKNLIISLITSTLLLVACMSENTGIDNTTKDYDIRENPDSDVPKNTSEKTIQSIDSNTQNLIEPIIKIDQNNLKKIRLSKAINTKQNEYYPVPNNDGSLLYFVGMDRTGQFRAKIDFTKTRDYGGEDIWVSKRVNGIYTDAIPLTKINDHTHQSVTGLFNNSLLVYGIYDEAYRVDGSGTESGFYNGDLFLINPETSYIEHLGQPINSIFFESDAFITDDGKVMLFITDRNPLHGNYEQKGWKADNEGFWGNTDIWLSEKVDDYWSQPINLGSVINTNSAERTPYLSSDKTKLYFSSNGHDGFGEQDVFLSTRTDMSNWTSWSNPVNLGKGVNGPYNDWGFKLYDDESKALLSSETKLPYNVDTRLLGDGGIREHNLRNGYKVEGKQSASFNYQCRSDIFYVDMINDSPIITIEDMLFEFNKYQIKSSHSNVLDRLYEIIKDNKNYSIRIKGHTDNVGDSQYNQELSEKRAQSIYSALKSRGIQEDRMEFTGYGETKPLVKNDTESNKKKNRRVEILFISDK